MFASAAAPEPGKAERQVWFPGNKAPDYLDGSLPGDFGFDPLGLGSDPQTLRWCAACAAGLYGVIYCGVACCCSCSGHKCSQPFLAAVLCFRHQLLWQARLLGRFQSLVPGIAL